MPYTKVELTLEGKGLAVPAKDLALAKDAVINRSPLLFGSYYAYYLRGIEPEKSKAKPDRFYVVVPIERKDQWMPDFDRAGKVLAYVFEEGKYLGYVLDTYDGKGRCGSTGVIEPTKD